MHSTDWDEWGVPHIAGADDAEVCFGAGHATAIAHATEALELYGIARGRSAALWGGGRFLKEDTFHAQLELDDVVTRWFDAQPATTLERVAAFCDGFNAACVEHPELGTDRRGVLPVAPRDVVAHMVRTFVRFTTIDGRQRAFEPWLPGAGSNGWAVAGSRSSTGNAMLVINPHLGWQGMHRWFELRTTSPTRSVHGVALLGLPWPTIGFNRRVGWTHTVNPIPNLNVYELDVDGDAYLFDGETRDLDCREVALEVRGEASVTVRVRTSVHGPVVTAPDGVQVAVRIAGVVHEPAVGALEAWWQMGQAGDVRDLLAAAQRWGIPMFNVLAADDGGSVLAAYLGTPPVHATATWEQTATTRLPGADASLLWDEVHPMDAMPSVVDPACGWVQNVNETPWWFCEPPLDPSSYPAGIAPGLGALTDVRSPASRGLVRALAESISPEDLLAVKWSDRAALADVVLDELVELARTVEGLREAADVLASWDRHARSDSPGYPLFALWFLLSGTAAIQSGAHATGAPAPGAMPTRLGDPAAAIEWLQASALTIGTLGLPLDVTLGTFVTMRERDRVVPADGGYVSLGVMKDLEPLPQADGSWVASYGDTYVGLVEMTPDGPSAQCLLPYGNVSEPSAPHYSPQIDLFAASQLRAVRPL